MVIFWISKAPFQKQQKQDWLYSLESYSSFVLNFQDSFRVFSFWIWFVIYCRVLILLESSVWRNKSRVFKKKSVRQAIDRFHSGFIGCNRLGMFLVLLSILFFLSSTEAAGSTFVINPSMTSDFPHYWEECVGSGHAVLGLREDWRSALKIGI